MNYLLLEHDPVYTIGRTPDRSESARRFASAASAFPDQSRRPGDLSWAGTTVGYPIIDLRRCGQDLHRYLRWIEELLIELLANYGIGATTRDGLTGVWVARSQDRFDRRWRASLDQHAWLRAQCCR